MTLQNWIDAAYQSDAHTLGEIRSRLVLLQDHAAQRVEDLDYWLKTCGVPESSKWSDLREESDDEWLNEGLDAA